MLTCVFFLLVPCLLPSEVNPLTGEALRLFEDGKRLFEQDKFFEAAKLFKSAKKEAPKLDREFADPWIKACKGGKDYSKVKSDMTSGHVALVWSGNVNAVITKLTIKGTLDLDWAEKKLGL